MTSQVDHNQKGKNEGVHRKKIGFKNLKKMRSVIKVYIVTTYLIRKFTIFEV